MSSLSTVEASLPPGFRFHPRDEELICDYLMKWVMMGSFSQQSPFLIEVDLNKIEPWDIPETACVGGKDWYFYSQRDRKYATGIRTNRATISGYWKATGKDRPIFRKGTQTLVGMRKTLVFYQGRAPKGRRTDWVMHEFRLEGTLGPSPKIASSIKDDWVLCRVFYKKSQLSEVGVAKQEIITCSSPSLPELVEPYNLTFDHMNTTHHQPINLDHHHQQNYHQQQQVPCFSILTPNQTNPTFSLIRSSNINHHQHPNPNNVGSGNLLSHDDLGNVINNYPSSDHQHHHDRNVIKAVLSHLTKMENNYPINAANNDYINPPAAGDHGIILKVSPSFGEGSSDSYLSEVGLSSMWNNFS